MSLVADCSSGKCPRVLMAVRTWRCSASMVFVVETRASEAVGQREERRDVRPVLAPCGQDHRVCRAPLGVEALELDHGVVGVGGGVDRAQRSGDRAPVAVVDVAQRGPSTLTPAKPKRSPRPSSASPPDACSPSSPSLHRSDQSPSRRTPEAPFYGVDLRSGMSTSRRLAAASLHRRPLIAYGDARPMSVSLAAPCHCSESALAVRHPRGEDGLSWPGYRPCAEPRFVRLLSSSGGS